MQRTNWRRLERERVSWIPEDQWRRLERSSTQENQWRPDGRYSAGDLWEETGGESQLETRGLMGGGWRERVSWRPEDRWEKAGGLEGRVSWRPEVRWEEVEWRESAGVLWEGTGGESQLETR